MPLELLVRPRAPDAEVRVVRLESSQVFLSLRPRPVPDLPVETNVVEERQGKVYVMKVRDLILRFSPEEHQTLRSIDGRTTVGELAFGWFLQFGSLDVMRVVALIQQARRAGLVEWQPGGFLALRPEEPQTGLRARLVRWLDWERRWSDVGPALSRMFTPIRHLFWPGLDVLWVGIGVAGVVAWWWWRPPFGAFPLLLWPIVAPPVALLLLFPHELGHAFAVLASGREVRAVGLSAQWLVPLPYVDTTDMYRSTRAAHARVAIAGPVANLVLGALSVGAALFAMELRIWPGVFWLVADVSFFLVVLNAWPFLVPGDGYNALCDLLGVSRLRQKAREQLTSRLSGAPPPSLSPGEAWKCWLYLAGVALSLVGSMWLLVRSLG